MKMTLAVVTLAITAASCGSSHSNTAKSTAAAETSPSVSTAASAKAPDAAAVVAQMRVAGIPVVGVYVVTEANDSNHLLGRPHGYSSKEVVTDSRVPVADRGDEAGVDQGASVEVYPDSAGAKTRATYLGAIAKAAPALANEYDYLQGAVLVRVTGQLTPTQAKDYQAVVNHLPS